VVEGIGGGYPRRQLDEPPPEPAEQVVVLRGLCLGLLHTCPARNAWSPIAVLLAHRFQFLGASYALNLGSLTGKGIGIETRHSTIEDVAAARIKASGGDALDDDVRQVREFRQRLREYVTARMGKPLRVTAAAVAPLNELLARDNSFPRVEARRA
jgi:hypothetical protein